MFAGRAPLRSNPVSPLAGSTASVTAPTLRGREIELATLEGMLGDMVDGRPRHLWIGGPSGIGKTALAHMAADWMRERGGRFVHGKFDQYQGMRPLSAVLDAAARLAADLSTQTQTQASAAFWRHRLSIALATQAQALGTLHPALRALLGGEPAQAMQAPQATQAIPATHATQGAQAAQAAQATPETPPSSTDDDRLPQALARFFGTVARAESPLVLVLDDVQWADAASLAMIEALLREPQQRFLMLIVTERCDAACGPRTCLPFTDGPHPAGPPSDSTWPASGMTGLGERASSPLRQLMLGPLSLDDVEALLADALHVAPECMSTLRGSVMERTLGNPYHVLELAREAVRRAPQASSDSPDWLAGVQTRLGTSSREGLSSLLGERLLALGRPARTLLQIAAGLGHEFSFATLAAVTSSTAPSGKRRGLARRMHRLVEIGALTVVGPEATGSPDALVFGLDTRFAFGHDRMQQAAHGLVDEERRRLTHRRIARALARPHRTSIDAGLAPAGKATAAVPAPVDAMVLEIASHYAQAGAAIEAADRGTAMQAFIGAARLAQRSGGHEQALRYLDLAEALAGSDPAQLPDDPGRDIAQARHAALCSLERHDEADRVFEQWLALRPQPARLIDVGLLQVASLYARERVADALELGLRLLHCVGVDIPSDFGLASRTDFATFQRLSRERPLERLVDAPAAAPAIDPLQRFFVRLSFVARRIDADTAFWLTTQPCLAWFRLGFAPGMCSAMASMVTAILTIGQDRALAARALRLGLAAARKRLLRCDGSTVHELQAVHGLCGVHAHGFAPLEEALAHSREALRLAGPHADVRCRIDDVQAALPASLDVAPHLDEAATEIEAAWSLAAGLRPRHHRSMVANWRQFVRALRGQTHAPGSFDDAGFDEAAQATLVVEPGARPDAAVAVFHVLRAFSAALYGDSAAVVAHARRAAPRLSAVVGTYPHAIGVAMLALGASIELGRLVPQDPASADRRKALLTLLAAHERWMRERAADAPRNFAHLHHYLVALRCAARCPLEPAQFEAALQAFDLAARTAIDHGRRLHAAFLLEEAARFHLSQGLEAGGRDLLGLALAHHVAWGTTGKIRQLQGRWPHLAPAPPCRMGAVTEPMPEPDAERLALVKASQALASVTDPTGLVKRIVAVIAEISGATDAGLFMTRTDDPGVPAEGPHPRATTLRADPSRWTLVAVAHTGQPVMALRESAAMAASHGFAPALVRHALGSLQAEVIDDIASDPRLRRAEDDPRGRESDGDGDGDGNGDGVDAGSAAWLPILSRDRPQALLLLEHRLTPRFFTARQLDTLELLTSQLASALHNAMLARSMEHRVAARTRELEEIVDDLRLRDRALAASTEAVTILDARSGRFLAVYVNAAFETLSGYASAEVVGQSLYRLYGSDTAQPGIELLREAIRQGVEQRATLRCYRKNGEMFWNEVSVAPVVDDDDRASHYVCINRDVTERLARAAAEQLRSERLAAVFELSPDGFVVLDAAQRVISVNPAFKAMTDMDEADLIGQPASAFEAALAARGDGARIPPWQSEQPATIRLLRPVPRVLRRQIRRSVDGGSDTVLYFRDVTREAEIDRMKSEFLATAAHELRTPMTSVSGFTELLLNRRLGSSLRIEMLQVIHRQTAALATLLDQLLDLARIEAGGRARFELALQPLQPVVAQAVSRLQMPSDAGRIAMRLPAERLMVRVDAQKLAIALTNALSNARKYSSNGPVVVEVTAPTGSGEIAIRVIDQGIGMTPEQTARMFERFFRVDPHHPVKGTGLGANIMKEIVEAHGGRIEVSSRPGEGTTVTFWLPGAADDAIVPMMPNAQGLT